jgi:hypothetical protein
MVMAFVFLFEAALIFMLVQIYSRGVPVPLWAELILWVVLLGFLLLLSRKEFYQRWVSFVCDSNACYFRHSFGLWVGLYPRWIDVFIKVPWDLIGEVRLAPRYNDGDGHFPSVLIEIKMSQQMWHQHCQQQAGTDRYAYPAQTGKDGQVLIVLANSFQKIEHIKARIDGIRRRETSNSDDNVAGISN